MKKIAVISAGWLGKSLCLELRSKGYEVVTYTSQSEHREELARSGVHLLGERFDPYLDRIAEDVAHVVVTVPPLSQMGEEGKRWHRAMAQALAHFQGQVIYCSSISVYPDTEGLKTEEDADMAHPLTMLEDEYQQKAKHLAIVRLGGLHGGNRHPVYFLAKKPINDRPQTQVNMIGRDNAIKAIIAIIDANEKGIWNVVFPEHPDRMTYYQQAADVRGLGKLNFDLLDDKKGKIISSEKLMTQLHFRFEAE